MFDRTTATWQERLDYIVETMREMSSATEAEGMVRYYADRVRHLFPGSRRVSLSRRDLTRPWWRVTRYTEWTEKINPWKEKERLPLYDRGLFGDLIYGDQAVVIDEIQLAPGDPSAEYLGGQRSLVAIPQFDQGQALNMIISTSEEPAAFDREKFPEIVWMSNLFGRATSNLVLSEQLREAYAAIDRELRIVAEIQRSLLPRKLAEIPTVSLAAHYGTSRWAGGDYYDFFPLSDGRYGILVADVSGHGTPAAVVMAITHSIAHAYPGPPHPPGNLLEYVNERLTAAYTGQLGTFVTAFYGLYDPATRELEYASAGHNPPRRRRVDGTVEALNSVHNLPLGILAGEKFEHVRVQFEPGETVVFYTDGITEAHSPDGQLFGTERLDEVLRQPPASAPETLQAILNAVETFANGRAPEDDQTVVVASIH